MKQTTPTFTRYQFPAKGAFVSLLTLRQKIGEASIEENGEDATYYGWWPNGELPSKPTDEYIPPIGGTITLAAPTFWGGPGDYSFTLSRVKYNVFEVVEADDCVSL